jgi:phosphodiesterase/alkaline phosphatase D-like protein
MKLSLWSKGSRIDSLHKSGFSSHDIQGLIALVADFPRPSLNNEFESYLKINTTKKDTPSFWFAQWQVTGSTLLYHPDREFGPILFAQHTLSKGIMKMTAQMPPLSEIESQDVHLEIKDNSRIWKKTGTAKIDKLSRTATFRIAGWDNIQDVPYRLSYDLYIGSNQQKKYFFEGTIRKDPIRKKEIIVAGFTGNNDLGFPNNELVKHVKEHQPDLLFFSGDQIYESVGGSGYIKEPLEKSCLDYLRKWYLYGWEYRELLRDIPTVSIPDDHDVYHGNLWGEAGKAASKKGDRKDQQDSGGYMQPPEWVNMVERTQTSHLPDPYDPTPVLQGIGVYYTDLLYGGVSFAIIEDRKFKSTPKRFFPKEFEVRNGWVENSQYRDPKLLNVTGAQLLDERQMIFLEDWIEDWSDRTWMKVLLSQTIFSTVATLPDSALSDVVVPKLRISDKGDYPKDDVPTQDMDSNGWPKIQRDRVLRILRKGFAIHLAGDQHLGSTIQYGVESWGDASFALCVPSIANYFPRRWFPKEGPIDWQAGIAKNLGKFYDGFGNKMTVRAVANPCFTGMKPSLMYDRAAGYGIIRMNKVTREIEMVNWPRQVDPSQPNAQPYEGWPVRFHQLDNYSRKAVAWLPTLKFKNTINPVVHIFDEKHNALVYALRIKDSEFSPKVFGNGLYRILITHDGKKKELTRIQSLYQKDPEYLDIEL